MIKGKKESLKEGNFEKKGKRGKIKGKKESLKEKYTC
jgi:hypothetical protein